MKLSAVGESIRSLETRPPVRAGRLTIVPLVGPSSQEPPYVLYGPEVEEEVDIREVDGGGSVPELRITNKAGTRVLVLDSVHLLGMKQNRIMNKDVLVPAEADIVAPVSCVERGRWARSSDKSSYGGIAPLSVRARKSRSMSAALKARGRAEADQGEVWESVDCVLCCMDAHSPSAALHDAEHGAGDRLEEVRERLKLPDGAIGVMALRDGEFAGLDLFDRASTLEARWADLSKSYVLEALAGANGESDEVPDETGAAILSSLLALDWTREASAGEGEDIRAESEAVVAAGLLYDGERVLHLQAYPYEQPPHEAGGPSVRTRVRSSRRPSVRQVQGAPAEARCARCGFMYATVRAGKGVHCNHCGHRQG
jgi:hypothetical protein